MSPIVVSLWPEEFTWLSGKIVATDCSLMMKGINSIEKEPHFHPLTETALKTQPSILPKIILPIPPPKYNLPKLALQFSFTPLPLCYYSFCAANFLGLDDWTIFLYLDVRTMGRQTMIQ